MHCELKEMSGADDALGGGLLFVDHLLNPCIPQRCLIHHSDWSGGVDSFAMTVALLNMFLCVIVSKM